MTYDGYITSQKKLLRTIYTSYKQAPLRHHQHGACIKPNKFSLFETIFYQTEFLKDFYQTDRTKPFYSDKKINIDGSYLIVHELGHMMEKWISGNKEHLLEKNMTLDEHPYTTYQEVFEVNYYRNNIIRLLTLHLHSLDTFGLLHDLDKCMPLTNEQTFGVLHDIKNYLY